MGVSTLCGAFLQRSTAEWRAAGPSSFQVVTFDIGALFRWQIIIRSLYMWTV